MTEQREPGALDMWKARQGVVISGIAVEQYHRSELDQARAEVERLSTEAATLRADLQMIVDRLTDERDQALYERDQCREAVEFSRGLIPTRPR